MRLQKNIFPPIDVHPTHLIPILYVEAVKLKDPVYNQLKLKMKESLVTFCKLAISIPKLVSLLAPSKW
jgi:hypothetical protein